MSRPNILVIHSDQHRFDSLSCNGHPLLETPNIDRLAEDGVNFRHAFTPSPICSPARGSLITGLWPTQHGCINIPGTESYRPMHSGLPNIFELLSGAGYDVKYVGKFHQETESDPTAYGVDEFIPQGRYGRWRAEQGLPERERTNGWFGEVDPGIEPGESRLAWGADHTIRMMRESVEEDTPFFVRWDPSEPHLPCIVPEPYNSMYPPESVPPWPSFPDSLEGKPYIQRVQRRRWDVEGWDWDRWAPVVGRYLGEIALLDAQVGRLMDALERLGVAEDTMVIYTTDHGDFCGGHGMMDKHYAGYDDIMRVPLVMRYHGEVDGGRECGDFVSHSIDLASTILAAAEVEIPETFEGQNLLDLASGHIESPREDIFSMYQGCQMGLWSLRMIRDEEYKLVYNATARPELYDLREDPGELNNLVDDVNYTAQLGYLSERLITWMEQVSDPLLNDWTRRHIAECLP